MKIKFIILFYFTFWQFSFAQSDFQFETDADKITIPFQLINNLIFIPINVNGIELNFLLDTGVEETILLSLDDKQEVNLNNIEKIQLSGLGSDIPIEGLKSNNNILSINGYVNRHLNLYIILDQGFNFSKNIGIPVNGIIGYQFFKNNLIEINYVRKKIIIYKDSKKNQEKIKKKYQTIPITLEKNKPYAYASVTMDKKNVPAKLLLDLGNSDALWLFQGIDSEIMVPSKNFDDFLGKGFSGDVFGKRTRISKFSFDKFEFENPIIVMPDSNSIKSVKMVENRVGSIGGEIFKRFTVVFDYKNNQLFLKKNSNYNLPFQYNLSGIELQNEGMDWVQETIGLHTVKGKDNSNENDNNTVSNFKYKFSLKPVYSIAIIRKKSPAELSGLKEGDIIKSINNVPVYKKSLQKNNEILKSEDGKWISLEIERGNQIMKFKFQVKSLL